MDSTLGSIGPNQLENGLRTNFPMLHYVRDRYEFVRLVRPRIRSAEARTKRYALILQLARVRAAAYGEQLGLLARYRFISPAQLGNQRMVRRDVERS